MRDSDGCHLVSDADGYIEYDGDANPNRISQPTGDRRVVSGDDCDRIKPISHECWKQITKMVMFDTAETQSVADTAIATGGSHTFKRVCEEHSIPL